jgi:hypothetical protein
VSICNIGSVPIGALKVKIEMTPVDACAKAILVLSASNEKRAVYHVLNTRTITLSDAISMLNQCGLKIDALPDDEFMRKVNMLVKMGKLAQVSGLVSELSVSRIEPTIRITADATTSLLADAGFIWPEINVSYIHKFIGCLSGIRSKKELIDEH